MKTGLYNSTYGQSYAHCNTGKSLWNEVGDGLSGVDIPFPVFFSKDRNDSQALIDVSNTTFGSSRTYVTFENNNILPCDSMLVLGAGLGVVLEKF